MPALLRRRRACNLEAHPLMSNLQTFKPSNLILGSATPPNLPTLSWAQRHPLMCQPANVLTLLRLFRNKTAVWGNHTGVFEDRISQNDVWSTRVVDHLECVFVVVFFRI